jgi:hypothetical protein
LKEVKAMNEIILNRDMLQAHLFSIIHTDKVKVRNDGGAITLIPIGNPYETIDGLCGICVGDGHEVDRFMARKQEEKELDR